MLARRRWIGELAASSGRPSIHAESWFHVLSSRLRRSTTPPRPGRPRSETRTARPSRRAIRSDSLTGSSTASPEREAAAAQHESRIPVALVRSPRFAATHLGTDVAGSSDGVTERSTGYQFPVEGLGKDPGSVVVDRPRCGDQSAHADGHELAGQTGRHAMQPDSTDAAAVEEHDIGNRRELTDRVDGQQRATSKDCARLVGSVLVVDTMAGDVHHLVIAEQLVLQIDQIEFVAAVVELRRPDRDWSYRAAW